MRVPDTAKAGKAKVTLSFGDWTAAGVAPATFDITLVDVPPDEEARAEREEKAQAGAARARQASLLPRQIADLKEQLKKETDPRKRQQIEELIGRWEKELRALDKP